MGVLKIRNAADNDWIRLGGAVNNAIHDNVAGEIMAITAKGTPIGADVALIEDTAASNVKKRATLTSILAVQHDHTESDITDLTHTGAPMMELIEKKTVSGSVCDFTGISGYSKIMVFFENVIPVTDAQDFHMRVYAGSWLSSAIYTSAEYIITNAGGTGSHVQTNDTELDVSGYSGVGSAGSEYGISGTMNLFGFNSSKFKMLTGEFLVRRSDGYIHRNFKGAEIRTTTALTGLRFYFTSGNLESGTITVYGIKDS